MEAERALVTTELSAVEEQGVQELCLVQGEVVRFPPPFSRGCHLPAVVVHQKSGQIVCRSSSKHLCQSNKEAAMYPSEREREKKGTCALWSSGRVYNVSERVCNVLHCTFQPPCLHTAQA